MILLVLPDYEEDDRRLARARKGDKVAITQIYESYFDPVYQFIRLRVSDTQTADDLTSQVFLKFITALQSDNAPRKSLRGWLFRVARNVIYDFYGKPEELPVDTIDQWLAGSEQNNPEFDLLQTLDVDRARRAIQMLAPAQQEVLLLRFDQQLSLKETADIMDKNPNSIKALQFRAVATLRQILLDQEDEHKDNDND